MAEVNLRLFSNFSYLDFDDCISDCDQSIMIDPTFTKSYYRKAKALEQQAAWQAYSDIGLLEQAIKNYKKVKSSSSSSSEQQKIQELLNQLQEKINIQKQKQELIVKINKINNVSKSNDFRRITNEMNLTKMMNPQTEEKILSLLELINQSLIEQPSSQLNIYKWYCFYNLIKIYHQKREFQITNQNIIIFNDYNSKYQMKKEFLNNNIFYQQAYREISQIQADCFYNLGDYSNAVKAYDSINDYQEFDDIIEEIQSLNISNEEISIFSTILAKNYKNLNKQIEILTLEESLKIYKKNKKVIEKRLFSISNDQLQMTYKEIITVTLQQAHEYYLNQDLEKCQDMVNMLKEIDSGFPILETLQSQIEQKKIEENDLLYGPGPTNLSQFQNQYPEKQEQQIIPMKYIESFISNPLNSNEKVIEAIRNLDQAEFIRYFKTQQIDLNTISRIIDLFKNNQRFDNYLVLATFNFLLNQLNLPIILIQQRNYFQNNKSRVKQQNRLEFNLRKVKRILKYVFKQIQGFLNFNIIRNIYKKFKVLYHINNFQFDPQLLPRKLVPIIKKILIQSSNCCYLFQSYHNKLLIRLKKDILNHNLIKCIYIYHYWSDNNFLHHFLTRTTFPLKIKQENLIYFSIINFILICLNIQFSKIKFFLMLLPLVFIYQQKISLMKHLKSLSYKHIKSHFYHKKLGLNFRWCLCKINCYFCLITLKCLMSLVQHFSIVNHDGISPSYYYKQVQLKINRLQELEASMYPKKIDLLKLQS